MTIDDKVEGTHTAVEPTYKELKLPTFVNSSPAIKVRIYEEGEEREIVLPFSDAPKIAVLSGTSFLSIGDSGCGKTLLMDDIGRNYFGGDSDLGGMCNFITARNNFVADNYYFTIDQSRVGEGKGMLSDAKVPVEKKTRALCARLDEINLVIPEIAVEFFGVIEGRHQGIELGNNGYYFAMSAAL